MRNLAFINLNALKENALKIREKLKPETKFCAVVKADAYGHGAEKCANALYPIVDCFAVAIAEEGIRLRLSGIDKDILVLTPAFKEDLSAAVGKGLTLSIENAGQLPSVLRECERQNKSVKIHIKYDTGMNRFGAKSLTEIREILRFARGNPRIVVDGLYSHLSRPEDIKDTETQRKKFLLANKLVKGYNRNITAHLSASGGFLSGEEFDMVRIGILLYGYKPFPSEKVIVKPVMKIYSPVLKRFDLKKGESALYGKRVAERDEDLSLVRYGYADGLPRKESVFTFNNMCMDVSLFKNVGGGSWFCVLKNAEELAAGFDTISYETLTKAAVRAEKIYIT